MDLIIFQQEALDDQTYFHKDPIYLCFLDL